MSTKAVAYRVPAVEEYTDAEETIVATADYLETRNLYLHVGAAHYVIPARYARELARFILKEISDAADD